jgi:NADH-quinone oxidoreductase subunit E
MFQNWGFLLAEIWGLVILAALLGLFAGWLIWGRAGVSVTTAAVVKPAGLAQPRGVADDLKLINGIGPALEELCHNLGFWHFDQIAAWTPAEIAWVDANLEGFKGRVTRDDWVGQAKALMAAKG